MLMSLLFVLMGLGFFMASFHFVRLSVDWLNQRAHEAEVAAALAAGRCRWRRWRQAQSLGSHLVSYYSMRRPPPAAPGVRVRPAPETGLPINILQSLPVVVYERGGGLEGRSSECENMRDNPLLSLRGRLCIVDDCHSLLPVQPHTYRGLPVLLCTCTRRPPRN